MTGKDRVTFYVESKELIEAVKKYAKENRFKLSEVYNEAVKRFISFNGSAPKNNGVDDLKRELEEVRNELRTLRRMLEQQGFRSHPSDTLPPPSSQPVSPSGLPSFLRDNPWVEILSERGNE